MARGRSSSTTIVYLFRHGIAASRSDPNSPPDPERPLTPKGIRRTRRAARGLRTLRVAPDAILSSPLLRAVQTATLAASELGFDPRRIEKTPLLAPDGDPEEALSEIRKGNRRRILCVGHAPHLDLVLARALGVQDATVAELKKAGAACLELPAGSARKGRLVWLVEPRTLRLLAGSKPKTKKS